MPSQKRPKKRKKKAQGQASSVRAKRRTGAHHHWRTATRPSKVTVRYECPLCGLNHPKDEHDATSEELGETT